MSSADPSMNYNERRNEISKTVRKSMHRRKNYKYLHLFVILFFNNFKIEIKSSNKINISYSIIFSFILSISLYPYQWEIIFYSKWYENRYNHLKNVETLKRTPYFQHHCNFNPISSSCWTAVNILLTWIHIFCNLFPSDPWWSSLEKRTQRSN